MDVSNSTGRDTDYKLTSGGGTRGEHPWQRLPGGSRVQREIEPDDGPWKVEFQVPGPNGNGVQTVSGRFSDPRVEVVLMERNGTFVVAVRSLG